MTHRTLPQRALALCVVFSMACAGLAHSAPPSLIGTEQWVVGTSTQTSTQRALLFAALERADVVQALTERGVSLEQARARVAALSDAQAAQLAAEIDKAPAGASDIVGAIVFVFLVLLVTDLLGLTKVFPFTRSVR
jgi:hypothetical protein